MQTLMTAGEVANELGISVSYARWLIDTGRLRSTRAGWYRLVSRSEVERMWAERREKMMVHA